MKIYLPYLKYVKYSKIKGVLHTLRQSNPFRYKYSDVHIYCIQVCAGRVRSSDSFYFKETSKKGNLNVTVRL